MKRNNKRALYESIMKDVSKVVKRHLNEGSFRLTDEQIQKLVKSFTTIEDKKINELTADDWDSLGTAIISYNHRKEEMYKSFNEYKSKDNLLNIYKTGKVIDSLQDMDDSKSLDYYSKIEWKKYLGYVDQIIEQLFNIKAQKLVDFIKKEIEIYDDSDFNISDYYKKYYITLNSKKYYFPLAENIQKYKDKFSDESDISYVFKSSAINEIINATLWVAKLTIQSQLPRHLYNWMLLFREILQNEDKNIKQIILWPILYIDKCTRDFFKNKYIN